MSNGDDERRALYAATVEHWTHSEQVRWALLYNCLMASTILLLAWAAIFSAASDGVATRLILALLACSGVVISFVWVALGRRASSFVTMYSKAGLDLEKPRGSEPIPAGPFACADCHRRALKDAKSWELAKWAPSEFVVMLVPGIFVVVYVVLAVVGVLYGSPRNLIG